MENSQITRDTIGYNSDTKNVFTTLGNVYDENLSKKVSFIKDPEKLLFQYDNLIKALGRQYAREFHTKADIDDLFSYIADTFVSLVREYDVTSGVDFAGYIAINLKYRVKYSYVNIKLGRANRVTTLASNTLTVEDMIDTKQTYGDINLVDKQGNLTGFLGDTTDLYDDSFGTLMQELQNNIPNFNNLDSLVVILLYNNVNTVNKLQRELEINHIKLDKRQVAESYNKIRDYLQNKPKE